MCSECDYLSSRKYDPKRHMKRHTNTPTTLNLPHKIAHSEPIPNITELTENEQLLRDMEQQELSDMLNTQAGIGLSQIPATPPPSSPPPVNNNNNNLIQQEFECFFFILTNLGKMILN